MNRYLLFLLLIAFNTNVYSDNHWYWGEISRISTLGDDGSFEIYLDNQDIVSRCLYDRVYFKASDMGLERTKAALSMALSAFVAGKSWGVVIDLPETEQACYASPTASQGAGIK